MMKKRIALLFLVVIATFSFCACGGDEEDAASADADPTVYESAAVNLSTFTEIAGEQADDIKNGDNSTDYIYEISDPAVGAAAYQLYRDYLDSNFTYSMTDSTVNEDGFVAVYYDENNARICYTEAVDGDDGSYCVTVSVPK